MITKLSGLADDFFKKGIIQKEQKERLEKTLKLVEICGGTPRCPKRLGLYIKDPSEKALQRAIYLSSRSFLGAKKKEILWGDAEVPVSDRGKSPRASCFDLVGKSEGYFVLCELKAGRSADHPLFGALELLVYYAVLAFQKNNKLVFHQNSIAKILKWENESDWEKAMLLVAADQAYWDKWENQKLNMSCFKELFGDSFGPIFFKIKISAKEHFGKQKPKASNYVPCLGSIEEWEEIRTR